METLLRDIRHGFRMLRQNSASFTMTAVVALALGIGANTAIFSLVNTVLLKEPPFPDPSRIVMPQTKTREGMFEEASPAKFEHWAHQTDVLEDVSAFGGGVLNWTNGELPVQLRSARVTSAFFGLFGVPFVLGRGFDAKQDLPGEAPVVVISEGLWKGRFARDPHIIGEAMTLEGRPHIIIGVVSSRFDFRDFGQNAEVWVPFPIDPNTPDQGHYFLSAGRLKNGVTLAEARSRLDASASAYRRKFPGALERGQTFDLLTLKETLVRRARQSIWILVGAVGFVLLIACANVANLLLARAEVRKRELGIRAALGAGLWTLVRQMLTESLLLAIAGAALGSALGLLGIRALLSVNTAGLPRVGEAGESVALDWRVLLFTVGIALFTCLLFGLLPALRGAHTDLNLTIKESANRSGSGFRQNKARTTLVIAEVALAVVLLVGAGLLIRTAVAIYSVNPGFDTKHVLTMRMSLANGQYNTSAAIEQMIHRVDERLNAIPGVELASATCCIPLEGGYGLPFRIMGRPLTDGPFHGGGGWKTVSPGYFEVFRIRAIRGRTFTERDNHVATPVVIINQAMARKYWPKGDPLQNRILIGKGVMPQLETEQPRQIIGIVNDQRDGSLNQDPEAEMYIPNGQAPDAIQALNVKLTPLAWVVRAKSNPTQLRGPVEDQLRRMTGLPVSDIRSMDEVVSRSTSRERFHMLLMSVFAGVSLLLAAIGIYGLMAYSVEQRTQEIGIRMALGAERRDVRGMVMRQGMTFAVLGILLGIAGAFALAKQISSFLFGVSSWDPAVFGLIPVVLLLTATIAIWWPADRATRIDPATALRQS
jgi:predicted permease